MSNSEVLARIAEMEDNVMREMKKLTVLCETNGFRIEQNLVGKPPTRKKKAVDTKVSGEDGGREEKVVKRAVNTMYWFKNMYTEKNEVIGETYTDEDVKNTYTESPKLKNKTQGDDDNRKWEALAIWKMFSKEKKQEMKHLRAKYDEEQQPSDVIDLVNEN